MSNDLISPLIIYNHNCPYCGKDDAISFVDNKGNYTYHDNTKSMVGARCVNCNKEFAITWNILPGDPEPQYSFSDMNVFIDNFMNVFKQIEERDIDSFLVSEF